MNSFNPQHPNAQMLLRAYANGVFPMADPDSGEIEWFSPRMRGIIPLDSFHAPANLKRAVRKRTFAISSDVAFEEVMRACATDRSDMNQSWIDERLIRAYTQLHEAGFAHSVEARLDETLVGGLYGVHLGGAFFGESMFSRPKLGGTNASKICLVHLVDHLRSCGFSLLDTQFWNEHLAQFGCIEIPRDEYQQRLHEAIALDVKWGTLTSEPK